MRAVASFAALILLPAPLFALDFSFAGPTPDTLAGKELKIATGVDPADPVTIDFPDAATAVVRQVKDDEDPSPKHPFYRFEWLSKDKTGVRFYPVTPQETIDQLRKQNDASLATPEGRALESPIVMAYINKGAVVQTCMKGKIEMPEALKLYVTLTPGKPDASAVVLPEGSIAECVLASTERGAYPAVKVPTTASLRLTLTPK
ncbi:MAG: hypothetical protein WDO12_03130 [Pseudomonadota bacterium]